MISPVLMYFVQQSTKEKALWLFLKCSHRQLWTSQCVHMAEAEPTENIAGQSISNLPLVQIIQRNSAHKLTQSKFEESNS